MPSKVAEIFDTLSYGPAPEAPGTVNAWLDGHGRKFGHFINGAFAAPKDNAYFETASPATGLPCGIPTRIHGTKRCTPSG